MGWAYCRFKEETGCSYTGSMHYIVHLPDLGILLNVPSMWKHYMIDHLVQPLPKEQEVVMRANPKIANGTIVHTLSSKLPEELHVLYVEKTSQGYTHHQSATPDTEFIEKLEKILERVQPLRTRGI